MATKTTQPKVKKADQKQERPAFDPSKAYGWEPTDNFLLTGTEFGFTYNVLQMKKAELLRELDMIQIFEAKLKQAVELGIAKERVAEAPAQAPKK